MAPVAPARRPRIVRVFSQMGIGGVPRGILSTLRRADRERFDYALLLIKKKGNWDERVRELDVPVHFQPSRPLWSPVKILQLARTIRRLAPDLLHVHMNQLVIPAMTAGRLAGVRRFVVHHHNVYDRYWAEQSRLLTRWEFALTRRADAILAVSQSVARASRRGLGLPDDAIEVVHNGIDLDMFDHAPRIVPQTEWGLEPGTPVVAHVSRYADCKRIEDFIAAAAIVSRRWPADRPRPAFVILGDGPKSFRTRYEALLARLGAGVHIWLEGGRSDLPSLLPHIDVGVLASEMEGCPNTILEFMAARAPIVATDIDPIAEIVEHGVEALLGPPRRPQTLAANIERLLLDRPLAERLAEAARLKTVQYSWDRAIRAYEAVYDRVLNAD